MQFRNESYKLQSWHYNVQVKNKFWRINLFISIWRCDYALYKSLLDYICWQFSIDLFLLSWQLIKNIVILVWNVPENYDNIAPFLVLKFHPYGLASVTFRLYCVCKNRTFLPLKKFVSSGSLIIEEGTFSFCWRFTW